MWLYYLDHQTNDGARGEEFATFRSFAASKFANEIFINLAEQITGDDAIGLHMAQSIPAGALDILEYAFRSSSTFGSGLDQLALVAPLP